MRVAGLAVLLCVGCVNRSAPDWARMTDEGTSGDATVTGAPLSVPRFAHPPALDGKLDDDVWAHAARTAPFVGAQDGAPAPGHEVAAFAKLGWDDKNLYVGAVIFDRSPVSPFQRDDVDPHDWEKSSALEVMLQPGDPHDNRDYYEMQFDVHGAIFDTHWDDYMTPRAAGVFGHQDWACKAERAVFVEDGRFYSMEVAIPWSALVAGRTAIPPRPGDVWRLDLYSFKDGQSLALAWSPIRGQGNFHRSSRFGRIAFAQ